MLEVTGGRSVCGVAEGGDGGPRELRVGTQGSAWESEEAQNVEF